ncbi:MAG: hypothetical protein KAJ09_03220 [Deltaproteobacteria bacterium]|nr:hypothetical protein [Deltaproteobacteria bacterium]
MKANRKVELFSIGIAILISMVGCVAKGPVFTPADAPNEKSLIYLYREFKVGGSGNVFTVFANRQPIADLPVGGYFPFEIEPGQVEFRAVNHMRPPLVWSVLDHILLKKKVLLSIRAVAGQTHYVRLDHGVGYVRMLEVKEQEAFERIKK